jgi:hypothetical protein
MDEQSEKLLDVLTIIGIVSFGAYILFITSGCMQIVGAERINAWGLEIESTTGFEVSAGVMQYNGADERKTMSKGVRDGR